jgi:ABC-type glutathione transport system ATPase component
MLNVNIISVSVRNEKERRIILKEIKFELLAGKIYTILGKNGSGKSTLIKSLSSLLPDELYEVNGKVIFNGTDILNTTQENLRKIRKENIRYVLQDVANSLDPLKKLKYYFDLTNTDSAQMENYLGYFLLPSYKKLAGLHSYELSGGMAQRVLIILALLANPNIIILDEPTSGVDYVITNLILLKLKDFINEKDKSVLIVTQDINFALKSSDYIAYLSNGKLSEFVPTSQFVLSAEQTELKNFIKSFREISNVTA